MYRVSVLAQNDGLQRLIVCDVNVAPLPPTRGQVTLVLLRFEVTHGTVD